MVDVEAAVDALLTTERRNPVDAGEEQRRSEKCRLTEAMKPQASAAFSLRGVTCAEDIEADQITAPSSAASGSNLLNSTTEHGETFDVDTFPISCFLNKDDRGVYTLSGSCYLCSQTFRAVGSVVKGKVQPWNSHARLQHNILQHARTHGAVGYTPHRNLDEMRLDWVRSPGEASKVIADASASRDQKYTTFCAGCAKWRRTTQFRSGASTCKTCLRIACATCGKSQKQTRYRSQDVYNFLNRRINIRCQTCRRKGTKIGGSKHKTHKGEHRRELHCTNCGLYQALSAFRRTKRRGRVDMCRSCELVPCAMRQ